MYVYDRNLVPAVVSLGSSQFSTQVLALYAVLDLLEEIWWIKKTRYYHSLDERLSCMFFLLTRQYEMKFVFITSSLSSSSLSSLSATAVPPLPPPVNQRKKCLGGQISFNFVKLSIQGPSFFLSFPPPLVKFLLSATADHNYHHQV